MPVLLERGDGRQPPVDRWRFGAAFDHLYFPGASRWLWRHNLGECPLQPGDYGWIQTWAYDSALVLD